jgi:hypothetical protein
MKRTKSKIACSLFMLASLACAIACSTLGGKPTTGGSQNSDLVLRVAMHPMQPLQT